MLPSFSAVNGDGVVERSRSCRWSLFLVVRVMSESSRLRISDFAIAILHAEVLLSLSSHWVMDCLPPSARMSTLPSVHIVCLPQRLLWRWTRPWPPEPLWTAPARQAVFSHFSALQNPPNKKTCRDVNVTVNVAGNDTENRQNPGFQGRKTHSRAFSCPASLCSTSIVLCRGECQDKMLNFRGGG